MHDPQKGGEGRMIERKRRKSGKEMKKKDKEGREKRGMRERGNEKREGV